MNKKYYFYIFFLFYLFYLGDKVNAQCNFKSGNYIEELSLPNQIKEIKIDISDSKKYAKNSIRILLDKRHNIRKRFKKKYSANIFVKYDFGECKFKGKVWQLGDWKDHIIWDRNFPLTSLNVKLNEGNILNAIKFKLLIPETRYGNNEILGSLIFRNLGFLAPETFEANVNINGNKSVMLFQEDSRKELLERNQRREGPIYEGDESIVFGNKDKSINFEYATLALTRLINWRWFIRGDSSQSIVLNSMNDLQYSYLSAHQTKGRENIVLPNQNDNRMLEDYYFLIAAMNGPHGLTLHNRKFHFNALENKFEPIYYDGNLLINRKINVEDKKFLFINAFSSEYYFANSNKIKSKEFESKLYDDFMQRVLENNRENRIYFGDAYHNFKNNIDILNSHIKNLNLNNLESDYIDMRRVFKDRIKNKNLEHELIKNISIDDNKINVILDNGEKITFSSLEFAKILSGKKVNEKRYIYLPEVSIVRKNNLKPIRFFSEELQGEIIKDPNINLKIDAENKKIIIKQESSQAWILFKGIKLNAWDILFEGFPNNQNITSNQQRFNKYGITGCLNFYKTKFDNASIFTKDGDCEDILNIISSTGKLNKIYIEDAYQDAIDFDFSNIEMEYVEVKNAGNDCLDVSSGNYILKKGEFISCSDKGISVGEKSNFYSDDLFIEDSNIAFSVKDLSTINTKNLEITGNNICIEAKLKKQEFGGGKVKISYPVCDLGKILLDENSIIELQKKNEF